MSPAPSSVTASVPPSSGALAVGTIVAERYRVEALLGEGGMGVVYLAEHVHMRKRVAIKVLLPEWLRSAEVVARFEREARTAGSIAHPNVAAATDFGRLADGSFFLVLEYVEGRTLRSLLEGGPLEPLRALRIVHGVVTGIGAAHAKGVVHRDLKPENVMLVARDGDPDFVKVLDFGVAKVHVGEGSGAAVLTTAGAIIGTPDYMAPEQALGSEIDARADLYAVGVMLHEMLAGECPFRGGAITLLRQHVMDAPPPLPAEIAAKVPPTVQPLLTRLLAKTPDARFANADDLLAALAEILDAAQPASSRAVSSPEPRLASPVSSSTPMPSSAHDAFASLRKSRQTKLLGLGAALAALVALGALAMRSTGTLAPSPNADPSSYVALPPPPKPHAPAAIATPAAPPPDPAPAPSATAEPAASASSTSRPASSSVPPPHGSARGKGRHTGPGGIYIPPPSQWFN